MSRAKYMERPVSEAPAENRPVDLSEITLQARALQSEMMSAMVARGTAGAWQTAHGLAAAIGNKLRRLRERRSTIAELSRLDERTLRDIGINPHDVEGAVDRLQSTKRDQSHAHLGDIVRHLDELVTPLRKWDLSRRAAGDMARMPSDVMQDLGYVRGDIDWVPEELAERKVARTPANHNEGPTKPHGKQVA